MVKELSQVEMFTLCNAVNIALRHYHACEKEGKDLDAAVYFARFVRNSGLWKHLHLNAADGVLPCDGKSVLESANKLEQAVCLRWSTNDSKPHVESTELEQIRAELAVMRAQLGLAPPLSVMKGGAE